MKDISEILKAAVGVILISLMSWVGKTLYDCDLRLSVQAVQLSSIQTRLKHIETILHNLESKQTVNYNQRGKGK